MRPVRALYDLRVWPSLELRGQSVGLVVVGLELYKKQFYQNLIKVNHSHRYMIQRLLLPQITMSLALKYDYLKITHERFLQQDKLFVIQGLS